MTATERAAHATQAEVTDAAIDAATRHIYHNGRPTSKEYRVGIARAILALRPEPVVSRNPFASRCYTMSESHLSGHRLIVGFEKLGDAQDAHEWVARQGRGDFTHPAPSVPKDDHIAALVNKVRDIARMFHDHQSLRERIAIELVPALKVSQEAKSDAERGRFLIEWLKRYGLLQAEFGQMGVGEKPENWWLLHAPWGIDQTRPFLGHGKTPEQAIDAAMLAAK